MAPDSTFEVTSCMTSFTFVTVMASGPRFPGFGPSLPSAPDPPSVLLAPLPLLLHSEESQLPALVPRSRPLTCRGSPPLPENPQSPSPASASSGSPDPHPDPNPDSDPSFLPSSYTVGDPTSCLQRPLPHGPFAPVRGCCGSGRDCAGPVPVPESDPSQPGKRSGSFSSDPPPTRGI